MDEPDAQQLIPSGTPVLGADGEPVGHVVATGAGHLLVQRGGAVAGDALIVHVPRDAVAAVKDNAVLLAATRDETMAAEQERTELVALLETAHMTPDRARLLRTLLEAMHAPTNGFA